MISKAILRYHGLALLIFGLIMSGQTLLGSYRGIGLLKFIVGDALRAVGLFEAYLLAGYSGFVFVLLSSKFYRKEWHLLPVIVHSILLITNIIFWNAYTLGEIQRIGYISTSAHIVFIVIETTCYLKQRLSRHGYLHLK